VISALHDLVAAGMDRPAVYSRVQALAGWEHGWRVFVDEHLRPRPGERILDIGCGPADLLRWLPPVRYLGVDPSAACIQSCQHRFDGRGRFVQGTAASLAASQPEPFDTVLMLGVLHHMDDAEARDTVALARRLLVPGGRLVSLDTCRWPERPWINRALWWADRGAWVRDEAGYRALVEPSFAEVHSQPLHHLLRLPSTHLLMVAHNATEPET
jgi:SAM-dependent methyltransferase